MLSDISFGQWLKQRRKANGLAQGELARQVGCATITLQKIEAGERRPSRQIAERLAEALHIEPDKFTAFIAFARAQPAAGMPFRAPSNLPTPATPLIGRQQDVADARRLLMREDTRLLTLIGPPGIGKTRLALQLAAEVRDEFDQGTFFISLAPITDPTFVLSTIGQTFKLDEIGGSLWQDRLADYLQSKQMLLVLDNFEQVASAAPLIAKLLMACPLLKVMVTSRMVLRVRAERQFIVPRLALPDLSRLPSIAELADYAAVAMFVDRAQAVAPNFEITNENASVIAHICHRLDGLPLALELVAAWVKVLSPAMLLERLSGRLVLQLAGMRDVDERHRTLRTAIAWSYDLLTPVEQRLFRQLGVFLDGWTLEAAERVCADTIQSGEVTSGVQGSALLLDSELLLILTSLVNKSLVVAQDQDGETRFNMLETLREYALEKLETSDGSESTHRRHAEYFVELAEAAELPLQDGRQIVWMVRLSSNHGNIRVALKWAQEQGDVETTLRLIGSTWRYWQTNNHVVEGRYWLAPALAAEPHAPPRVLANAYHAAGALALYQYDYQAGLYLHEQGAAWAREAHDDLLIGLTLNGCSAASGNLGDFARAEYMAEQSRAHSSATGQKWPHACALFMLCANAQRMGDYDRVFELGQQSKDIFLEQGDLSWSTAPLRIMSEAAVILGKYEQAKRINSEALAIMRTLGVEFLSYNGVCEHLWTSYELAARFSNALRMARLGGAIEGIYARAGNFAYQDLTQYHMPAAMRHYMEVTGIPVEAQAFAAAWADGQDMTIDEVMQYALVDDSS